MTNKLNFNNKALQNTTLAVMKDILSSNVTGSTLDDLYQTACKYVQMTREEFEERYQQAEEKIESWKKDGSLTGSNNELTDEDLDMVVGGSIGSFFSAIGEGIASAACAVGNFVKENAPQIAIAVGVAALAAGLGACVGVLAIVPLATELGVSVTTIGTACILGGTGTFAAAGFGASIYFQDFTY